VSERADCRAPPALSTLMNRTMEEKPVPAQDRPQVARDSYGAYVSGDRGVIEAALTEDFRFSSPADVDIDRATYFERCWPSAGSFASHEFARLEEVGDEVLVTYEATRTDGSRFRNTEILTFRGDRICRVEVYFGWNL